MNKNPHEGTNFYDYLKEEGVYEEVHTRMVKEYGHLIEKDKTNFFKKIWILISSVIMGFFIR